MELFLGGAANEAFAAAGWRAALRSRCIRKAVTRVPVMNDVTITGRCNDRTLPLIGGDLGHA